MRRREFLKKTALAAFATPFWSSRSYARKISANDKLNLGIIGVANRAADNFSAVSSQNIVALCDVDDSIFVAHLKSVPLPKPTTISASFWIEKIWTQLSSAHPITSMLRPLLWPCAVVCMFIAKNL